MDKAPKRESECAKIVFALVKATRFVMYVGSYAILPNLDKLLYVNDHKGIWALDSRKHETGYLLFSLSSLCVCFSFSFNIGLLVG